MASGVRAPRERWLGLLALVVVLAWAAGRVAWPLWDRWQMLRRQSVAWQARLARLQLLAARASVVEDAADASAGTAPWPSDMTERQLLDEVEQLAGGGQLQLTLKPQVAAPGRWGLEIEVDGHQPAVLAFLDRLLALPARLELERLTLHATGTAAAPLRATIVIVQMVPAAATERLHDE